jgi:hypothetical protein
LIPQLEGETVIPPIQVSYFDPTLKRYETIQSAPVHVKVKPGSKEQGRQVVFTGSGENIEVLGRDIHFIHPVPAQISLGQRRFIGSGVFAALHVVPLVAVIMSFVVSRRRRRWISDTPAYRSRFAAREADKRLQRAADLLGKGETLEAFSAVSAAVRGYIADKMNKSALGLTDDEVVGFLADEGVGDDVIVRLRSVLKICDGARYSTEASSPDQAESARQQASEVIVSLEGELR